MGHDPGHHAAQHDAHGGGHAAAEETEEQRQDRLRAQSVELAWARFLRIPGLLIAFACAGILAAWVVSRDSSDSPVGWAWLLLIALVLGWGLALSRGGDPEPDEPAPSAHH